MREMIAFAKHDRPAGHAGIAFRENPDDVSGLQFLLHTRILVFETPGFSLKIDMIPQPVAADTVAVIPPLHLHQLQYLSGNNFLCIDMDDGLLSTPFQRLLYTLKYSRQKVFPIAGRGGGTDLYAEWVRAARQPTAHRPSLAETEQWLTACLPALHPSETSALDNEYARVATQFLDLLACRRITADLCKVNLIASELCHSERTLHRIFTSAFGYSVKSVLNYHLAMKGIYLLAEPSLSVSDVAFEMNFSSVGVFGRYMKKYTGCTPSDIKKHILAAAGEQET